jgi:chromosome segregation ATPase
MHQSRIDHNLTPLYACVSTVHLDKLVREIKAPKRVTARKSESKASTPTLSPTSSASTPSELMQPFQQIVVQQATQIGELTRKIQELEQRPAASSPNDAKRIADLTAELLQLRNELQAKAPLEVSLSSLSHAYNELEAAARQKDDEISRLTKALALQAPVAMSSSAGHTEQVTALQQTCEQQRQQIDALQQSNASSAETIRKLTAQQQEYEKQQLLQQQQQQQQEANITTTAELEELRTKVAALEAARQESEQELEEVLVLLAKCEMEKTHLDDRVKQLEQQAR